MTRTFWAACLFTCISGLGLAQSTPPQLEKTQKAPAKPLPNKSDDEGNPPEEDESEAPEKFVLNPLESERNIKVGDQYWNKKKYIGAAGRYSRATKFNPNSAQAFYKLGEAEEKLKNSEAARSAFAKVVALAPDSKLGKEAKKKLGIKG